ncbi:tRNA uridine-5-carboxymethylaminomethyl(34) synthesis GTPase MnmE [Spiroplasma turonicum]|uniref:tRNA modification GTPase MnmE n=1 Tax=Spiroplasma turonicum TaxID=216946 RepID=A0A0K1P7R5_9MOLU|nr:tRNA uridine-5-carboxymethylaminomethyl(34) synthesis GTPase MnmE [Spiroplasma turonicum]AKU80330.1 tRNA modification GTPase TrmE [Spiroplasma turonicum]ALX71331.1 tRNA modification GTPase TrmE [Spiroplasma turonicum]
MENIFEDIIVASATKISTQAISIIRVSGQGCIDLINKIINKPLNKKNNFYLRKVIKDNNVLDECLFLVFEKNKSFTGDETVEINCHGGVLLTNTIIKMIIKNGARLAKPGEFSQRAFLNGKIDLIQAESINNLINSKNELSIKLNAKTLVEKNNPKIQQVKSDLLDIISKLQTALDYPEYEEVENISSIEAYKSLSNIEVNLKSILEISKNLNYINEGVKTLILGETNVGKSSLLNALLNEEKAIVTDIEGTTRDLVEGTIYFKNFNLNLIDSAGIRETKDKVELMGIDKTYKLINEADLILFVINKDKFNLNLYNIIKEKEHIVILNKVDLLSETDIKALKDVFKNLILVSALKNNINELKIKLEDMYDKEELLDKDYLILTNTSHIKMFETVLDDIKSIKTNIDLGFDIDIILIDLKNILITFNNLLGIIDSNEEILDNIFRKYCLGK